MYALKLHAINCSLTVESERPTVSVKIFFQILLVSLQNSVP